ncbi:MAG: hypothetical protein COZ80_03860 [Ignavibacteria bacterium CG_4_8_14_3_um_filter_37_9]|nr:MAG: hypothetical protein AUJ54_05990 [Ignavibacteria bacterium CG1_02_37_35]PIW99736.1 MAG: hypothetical protein COZ80_03860 [Ignavibacteria bacterium CG_4_8_14_3_um_filter_37_9]PIX93871.1 MAG: hypothetical protein COZ25_08595 [Ignavibacteria bacterium CG_4_10_14_3_um_filter_37_18]PJC60921.1 MAG: hypothetical protein CO025_01745 [Ignavibacteria bacterium CG_4_9_14_0_2_um_filter_37_13]
MIKFIADVNIEKLIVVELRKAGYDVTWILETDKYLEDVQILLQANIEKRILLTNDKDFGELVYRQKLLSSGIILFRVKEQDEKVKYSLLKDFLLNNKESVYHNFIVITKNKIRIIKL